MAAGGQPLADDDRVGAILVTSPSPAEGKTTIAVNLAAAFAETGRSVVLVNADFRRPLASKIVTDERPTLPAALDGIDRLDPAAFLAPTKVPGVAVAGPLPARRRPRRSHPGDGPAGGRARRAGRRARRRHPAARRHHRGARVRPRREGRRARGPRSAARRPTPAQRAGELARFGGAEQVAVALNDTGSMRLRRTSYYDYYGGRARPSRRSGDRAAGADAPETADARRRDRGGREGDDEWHEIDELVERADGTPAAGPDDELSTSRALATTAMTSAAAVYRLNRANAVAWAGLAAIAVYFACSPTRSRAWPYDEWMVLLLVPLRCSPSAPSSSSPSPATTISPLTTADRRRAGREAGGIVRSLLRGVLALRHR